MKKWIWILLAMPAVVGVAILILMGAWAFADALGGDSGSEGFLVVIAVYIGAMAGFPAAITGLLALFNVRKRIPTDAQMRKAKILVIAGIVIPPLLLLPVVIAGDRLGARIWEGTTDWNGIVTGCQALSREHLGTNAVATIDLDRGEDVHPAIVALRPYDVQVSSHAVTLLTSRGATVPPEIVLVVLDPGSPSGRRFAGKYKPVARGIPVYRLSGGDGIPERVCADLLATAAHSEREAGR